MTAPEGCDLLIRNATVVTGETVLHDGWVAVRGDRIVGVGSGEAAAWQAERVIDGEGGLLHPGYVDGHYHLGLHLLRGILPDVPDDQPIGPFGRWLNALTPEDELVSARTAAAEAALAGFTGIVEAGSAFDTDAMAEGVTGLGLRVTLAAPMIWDRPGPEPLTGKIDRAPCDSDHAMRHLGGELHRNAEDGLARGHVAYYGTGSSSEEVMAEAARLAREAGVPMHAHQNFTPADAAAEKERYGRDAIVHMAEAGLIGPETVFTHMNVLSDAEVEAVVETGMALVWHPANAAYYGILAQARSRFPELARRGVDIGFGTDVAKTWGFGDLGFAAFLTMRAAGEDVSPETLLKIFTTGGARAMGLGDVGRIAVGQRADIVLRRADLPEAMPEGDPLKHLTLTLRTKGVRHSFCAGRQIVEDGALVRADVKEIGAAARATARGLAERADLKLPERAAP